MKRLIEVLVELKQYKCMEADHWLTFLAHNVDDSVADCPAFTEYVGQLLAALLKKGHLQTRDVVTFWKQYEERSELKTMKKKRERFSRIVKALLSEVSSDSKLTLKLETQMRSAKIEVPQN